MNPQTETVYLVEILAQCRNARPSQRGLQRASNALVKIVRQRAPGTPGSHIARLFDDAADFLQHAAAVSRIFWPPKSKKPAPSARARYLLDALAIRPGNPLESRTLRDHLEHYDERLDKWAAVGSPILVDGYFGPRGSITGSVYDDSNIMRLYDPTTSTFFFRGESFDLRVTAAALRDIATRAGARLRVIDPGLLADLTKRRLL